MSVRLRIFIALAVILNAVSVLVGAVALINDYNIRPFEMLYYVLVIAAPLASLYLIFHELRREERRLERQVKLLRLRRELRELGG